MHSCGNTAVKAGSWPNFWANLASFSPARTACCRPIERQGQARPCPGGPLSAPFCSCGLPPTPLAHSVARATERAALLYIYISDTRKLIHRIYGQTTSSSHDLAVWAGVLGPAGASRGRAGGRLAAGGRAGRPVSARRSVAGIAAGHRFAVALIAMPTHARMHRRRRQQLLSIILVYIFNSLLEEKEPARIFLMEHAYYPAQDIYKTCIDLQPY
jgi:hypothetical protein